MLRVFWSIMGREMLKVQGKDERRLISTEVAWTAFAVHAFMLGGYASCFVPLLQRVISLYRRRPPLSARSTPNEVVLESRVREHGFP